MTELRKSMIVTSKRCKKCRWSTPYTNWTPPSSPKLPATWYCMNKDVSKILDDCKHFSEPYEEEE